MRALVMAAILGMAAPAWASTYSVAAPEGWLAQPPEVLEQSLADLRKTSGMVSVEGAIYTAPDESAQLTMIFTKLHHLGQATRSSLEVFEKGMAKGTAGNGVRHISDDRRFEAGRLLGDGVDEVAGGMIMKGQRIVALDKDELLHVLNATCIGVPESDTLAACEAAQRSVTLTVPNEIAIPESAKTDMAYLLGQIVGGLGIVALLIWLIKRNR